MIFTNSRLGYKHKFSWPVYKPVTGMKKIFTLKYSLRKSTDGFHISYNKLATIILAPCLIILSTSPARATPSINVGAMLEIIGPEQRTLAKRINNSGSSTAFIRVTVDEIVFDKSGNTLEKPLNDSELISGKGTGLIASPARMIVPSQGMQTSRLLFTGSRDKERYYRVRYLPVVPKNGAEFGLDTKDTADYRESISAGLTVLSGFGTIITVAPETISYRTSISEHNGYYRIVNNGNGSVLIDGLTECAEKLKSCSAPLTRQLLPGREFSLQLLEGRSWKYQLVEGNDKKNKSFGKL